MSADFTPEKEDYRVLPPFKMQVLTNFPYIEADFDALTNYQLLCKVVEYLNNVITNENEVTEQVTSLYNAYVSLQNYVNHYFDTLDLQTLVDNKLDEMAESGELADMIAEYIKMQGQLVYNSVAEMKEATNIQNGSFLKTYGYYSYNDNGGALYKARTILNTDTIDNMTIIKLSDPSLIAELIAVGDLHIKQLGAKGDNETDESDIFLKAIDFIKENKVNTLIIDKGDYIISKELQLLNINNLTINCYGHIFRDSEETTNSFLYIKECSNINLNGLDIESIRNQQEPAPAGHTRTDTTGSNIIGIFIEYSENINIDNYKCENLACDININSDNNTHLSKNINVNNYESYNTSGNVYTSYVENVSFNNCKMIPAQNMGSGDHCIYMGLDSYKCYVNNSIFQADDTFGAILHPYQGNVQDITRDPKYLYVENCQFKGKVILSCNNKMTTLNNCYLENNTDGTADMIRIYNYSEVYINNSIIKSSEAISILSGTTSFTNKLVVNNCDIDFTSTSTQAFIVSSGSSQNSYLNIKNCNIKLKNTLFYVGSGAYSTAIIENNNIIYDNTTNIDSICSDRSDNSMLYFRNNQYNKADTGKANYICYNPSLSVINTFIYNNICYGLTRLNHTSSDSYTKQANNYIDDTLVV